MVGNNKRKLYKIPSDRILNNRRKFYDLKRKDDETIEQLLYRVFSHIDDCDFPASVEYILTDKFVCELNAEETEFLRKVDPNWSMECVSIESRQFSIVFLRNLNFYKFCYFISQKKLLLPMMSNNQLNWIQALTRPRSWNRALVRA